MSNYSSSVTHVPEVNLLAGSSGERHADDVGDLLSGSEEDLAGHTKQTQQKTTRKSTTPEKRRLRGSGVASDENGDI